MITINNNLARLAGEKLVKISQISKDTGISRTTLTNLYYKRSGSISGRVLDSLCRYFGCTVGELLELNGTGNNGKERAENEH